MRCLAFRDGARCGCCRVTGCPLNGTYPEIVEALGAQESAEFVIDGEIVAFEGRRTSFARLQGRSGITNPEEARATGIPVFYYVFDLLHLDGTITAAPPLTAVSGCCAMRFGSTTRCATPRIASPTARPPIATACGRGDEGVIAKRAEAPYEGGRSSNWLKFKCSRDQEFVIVGYTAPKGSRVGFGALLLGYYDGADLVYAGKVGTGFDTATLRSLHERLSRTEQDDVADHQRSGPRAGAHWVRPKLVAQVAFSEWTRDGKLRHPRYLGLRTDKSPDDVVRESR